MWGRGFTLVDFEALVSILLRRVSASQLEIKATSAHIPNAGECVASIHVHRAGATDTCILDQAQPLTTRLTLSARAAESKGGINFVLDDEKGIEEHGAAFVEVNLVLLVAWLVVGLVGVL